MITILYLTLCNAKNVFSVCEQIIDIHLELITVIIIMSYPCNSNQYFYSVVICIDARFCICGYCACRCVGKRACVNKN